MRVISDEEGNIFLPREVVREPRPCTGYEVEADGNVLVLRPVEAADEKWAHSTPEERAKRFMEWFRQPKPRAPVLPEEAMHRESFYD